jgi:hypothetical protein
MDILAYRQDHTWDADMDRWADEWLAADEKNRIRDADRKAAAVHVAIAAERAATSSRREARSGRPAR